MSNSLDFNHFCDFDNPDDLNFAPLVNYATKHIENWSNNDVLDFICYEILLEDHEIDVNSVQRFSCISGYIFKGLSEDNCKILSNSNYLGSLIYNAKEEYLRCNQQSQVDVENISISMRKACPSKSKKKGAKQKPGKRSEKLWEFLLHLLKNRETCPDLIKWINFEEGTFKFVQSNTVARLWGNRKKNEKMTYEKFSRAMRYYYKSKVLLPVPGQRLVYKFGPQAKGWKNIKPIL